jgi:transglutaminase-like putative cysteine protease
MARVYQVPRHAFVWLQMTLALAVLPHAVLGPAWLGLLAGICLVWRWLMQRGRIRAPGRLLKVTLLGGAFLATLYSHGTITGPVAGVSLLVSAFALKSLETNRLRDAYVIIVLAYFVLATVFLADRGILATVYVISVLLVVTAALVGLNHPETGVSSRSNLRVAGVMLLQCMPLMLLMFLLVPRMDPLWSMDVRGEEGRSGMSDSMAPGEIGKLSLSNELAFRVEFDGDVPPPTERYWRGLTYEDFDGRRWSQARPNNVAMLSYMSFSGREPSPWMARLQEAREGRTYSYQVVVEPTGRRWLFAMPVPFTDTPGIGHMRDMRLFKSSGRVEDTFAYRVTSYPYMRRGIELTDWQRRLNLDLPSQGNPKARELARQWRAEAGSDRAFAERLMRWFAREEFWYTLEPPPLGRNTVDDFLFETRRGFCEHYASSFVFMMRAAGIPARVVAGYQGGEVNPMGDHLRVRQRDAHAWTEIWLPESGWVRFDPTFAVAPSRIEFGLDQALEEQGESVGDGGFGDAIEGIGLFQQLGFFSDYMAFAWQKWVLNYDVGMQLELFEGLLGRVTPTRLGLALLVALAVVVLPLAAWVLLRRRPPPATPTQREFWRMLALLERAGLSVSGHMPPRELARQAAVRRPGVAGALQDWARLYEGLVYAGREPDREALQTLREQRRKVRRQLISRRDPA